MVKCIMFDFDGVIAESVHVKTQAFYQMYLPYGEKIANTVRDYHLSHGGISRVEKFKYYEHNLLDKKHSDINIDNLCDEFSKLVLKKVIESPFVSGVMECLEFLKQKEVPLWIISGTPQDELRYIVEKKGLRHFFEDVYGSPTTKTQWINKILKDRGYQPKECLFLGDATTDYDAAKETNLHFLLRLTSETSKELKSNSLHQLEDFSNLTLFKALMSNLK